MNRILAFNPVANSMDDGLGAATMKKSQSNNNIDNNLNQPLLDKEDKEQINDVLTLEGVEEVKSQDLNDEEKKDPNNDIALKDADENPVIRAAYIHILGDMIQSSGVLLASLLIFFLQDSHPGIRILDPICTFCFAIVVLCITVPVSRDCTYVLLEMTPKDFDAEKLFDDLNNLEGVEKVHDIHLWNISIGRPSIALHIVCEDPTKTLKMATEVCQNHGINHCTIQAEGKDYVCRHEEENDIH